jgi:acyl carrier protein phosphodiesterase
MIKGVTLMHKAAHKMNLLAHAYLSFEQPEILVGNMISDYVKGNKKFAYSNGVQKGITLHRAIDEFTDNHEATKSAKKYFREPYHLYAGAFVDIVYDHFLANDINEFENEIVLNVFCRATYKSLEGNKEVMPEKFSGMLPYMQQQNWLYNYRYREGIERSFEGLVRRAAYLKESEVAFKIFNEQYIYLQQCYAAFFPSLKSFAIHKLNELNKN